MTSTSGAPIADSDPSAGQPAPEKKEAPHTFDGSLRAVFVNGVGRESMFNKASVTFPVGSIIVLEKLARLQKTINGGARGAPTPSPPPEAPFRADEVRLATIDDFGPPELLAVMLKREKGFNPQANDWEFLTVSGDAKTIVKREKMGSCQECHTSQKDRDFVFRTYVP